MINFWYGTVEHVAGLVKQLHFEQRRDAISAIGKLSSQHIRAEKILRFLDAVDGVQGRGSYESEDVVDGNIFRRKIGNNQNSLKRNFLLMPGLEKPAPLWKTWSKDLEDHRRQTVGKGTGELTLAALAEQNLEDIPWTRLRTRALVCLRELEAAEASWAPAFILSVRCPYVTSWNASRRSIVPINVAPTRGAIIAIEVLAGMRRLADPSSRRPVQTRVSCNLASGASLFNWARRCCKSMAYTLASEKARPIRRPNSRMAECGIWPLKVSPQERALVGNWVVAFPRDEYFSDHDKCDDTLEERHPDRQQTLHWQPWRMGEVGKRELSQIKSTTLEHRSFVREIA
ncbi:hypothetical protein DFJ77DRAFT_442940 [Powellomyces hirtus]|nr:hypothetical protein DFJ77DRAFT_442940 [Powellomyces hirtus]